MVVPFYLLGYIESFCTFSTLSSQRCSSFSFPNLYSFWFIPHCLEKLSIERLMNFTRMSLKWWRFSALFFSPVDVSSFGNRYPTQAMHSNKFGSRMSPTKRFSAKAKMPGSISEYRCKWRNTYDYWSRYWDEQNGTYSEPWLTCVLWNASFLVRCRKWYRLVSVNAKSFDLHEDAWGAERFWGTTLVLHFHDLDSTNQKSIRQLALHSSELLLFPISARVERNLRDPAPWRLPPPPTPLFTSLP